MHNRPQFIDSSQIVLQNEIDCNFASEGEKVKTETFLMRLPGNAMQSNAYKN